MRKEFHTWHYSGGKLLTGCWTGVTVYQYLNEVEKHDSRRFSNVY